jgi:DNA-directed RNA polymerase specialized sigma24 family protein
MLISHKLEAEDIFARHYDWLLKWASYLTRGHKDEAEDLVHELYIQFLRTAPHLNTEQDAKAYLYRSLRNLYLAERSRSARTSHHELSVYEYDSLHLGISSIDRSALLSVHQDLRNICRYACDRKSFLRAASYFILRFFLDYCPSEIMALGNCSRASVDKGIQLMRSEVRNCLSDSDTVVAIRKSPSPALSSPDFGHGDVSQQIHRFIHEALHGDCLSQTDVHEIYRASTPVETLTMAHLTSCARCRSLCFQHLGKNDKDLRGREADRKGPVSTSKRNRLTHLRRSYQANFEHRPTYLHLTLNGKNEASQRIGSLSSELAASAPFDAETAFLEVTSEQGIRLLSFHLDDDFESGARDTVVASKLSDGRSITAQVSMRAGILQMRATYFDPTMEANSDDATAEEALWIRPTHTQKSNFLASIHAAFTGIYWPPVVALALPILLLGFYLLSFVRMERHQALKMLAQTRIAEQTLVSGHDLHRTGTFQMKGPDGLMERRLDVWETASPSRTTITLLGPDGRSQGTADGPVTAAPIAPAEMWRIGFDPGKVEQLLHANRASVTHPSGDESRIEVKSTIPSSAGEILSAAVVLDRKTNRILEQSFIVQTSKATYRIRLREVSFEVLPRGTYRPRKPDTSGGVSSLKPRSLAEKLSIPQDIVHQHINALWGLEQAGMESDEQIEVTRRRAGVAVSGVVSGPSRKHVLSVSLLRSCADCIIDIHSSDALRRNRTHRAQLTSLQTADVAFLPSSAEVLLRSSSAWRGAPEVHQISIARLNELNSITSALVREFDAMEKTATCCTLSELGVAPVEEQQRWAHLLQIQAREANKRLALLEAKLSEFNTLAQLPETNVASSAALEAAGPDQIKTLHQQAASLQMEMQQFGSSGEVTDRSALQLWQSLESQVQKIRQEIDRSSLLLQPSR